MNMAKKGSAPGQSHITKVVLCTPDTQKQSVQMPNTARATDLMNLISAFPAAENNPENPFPPKFHLSHESSSKSFLSHITHSWRVPVQAKRLVDHPFELFYERPSGEIASLNPAAPNRKLLLEEKFKVNSHAFA